MPSMPVPGRRSARLLAAFAIVAVVGPVVAAPAMAVRSVGHGGDGPGSGRGNGGAPGGAIVPGSVGRTSYRLDATYEATLRLGWASRAIRVSETIAVTNTSGGPIDRLELNAVPARLGAMRLGTVTVDGRPVPATVSDQTIVVPLGGVLDAGAATRIGLSFSARLRTTTGGSDWMFTRRNGIADLYRWLPWVSRRTAFVRPNIGDPFVTPVSRQVRLTIVTDRPLRIVANGRRTYVSPDRRTQTFVATNVRDVPITAATDYRTSTRTVDGITVVAYTRPGGLSAAALTARARTALSRMADLVGPYPYPTFRIAESAGGLAMEGPGVIWIPRGTPTANLSYLVTHETAHQWFYGLAGNDQASQPFADEAAADFLARHVLGTRRASRCAWATLDRTIQGYSRSCYYEIVYIQGGGFLDYLRRRMGNGTFWRALRGYIAEQRWDVARTQDLLTALDAATPLNLRTLYARRFPRFY
jgi:hypothetical protein